MTPELYALVLLVLLQMVMGLAATAAIGQAVGGNWLFSSRGDRQDLGNTLAGRLHRARANGFEAITYFAPIALTVAVADASTSLSATAAWTYVGARIVYWLCYGADLTPWRTIVWFVGWFALLAMALPLIL